MVPHGGAGSSLRFISLEGALETGGALSMDPCCARWPGSAKPSSPDGRARTLGTALFYRGTCASPQAALPSWGWGQDELTCH